MEDLVQSQIKDSCRLALPEGLRDLMCDISREVLRAQPTDIYKFIADYLSALLLTRETLSIACHICRDVCECSCRPELEEELRYIGLDEQDLELVQSIVLKYLDKCKVKECNLFMELFKNTRIDEDTIQAIQEAVRRAFFRHQLEDPKRYEMPLIGEEARQAADHTLSIYHNFEDERDVMATKIQALFRGYLVRKKQKKNNVQTRKHKRVKKFWEQPRFSTLTVSSQSLAGSFLNLPRHVPYAAHRMSPKCDVITENQLLNHSLDYSEESTIRDVKLETDEGKKKIVFNDSFTIQEIESCSRTHVLKGYCSGEQNTSDDSIEEHIVEDNSINEDNSDIEEDLGDNHKVTTYQMLYEYEQEASSSRDLDQEETQPSDLYGEDSKDPKPTDEGTDWQESKPSENSAKNINTSDLDLQDLITTIVDMEEQKTKEDNDDAKSIKTLNSVNRDQSMMVKPVDEFIDLKTSLQKIIEKRNEGPVIIEEDEQQDEPQRQTLDDITEEIIRDKRYSS